MRKINIRLLRKNLSKELNNLPFEITRHEKVIAVVSECVHNEPEIKEVLTHEPIKYNGYCEQHFERGKTYDLRLVQYEDSAGNTTTPKKMCSKCIKEIENHVTKEGGRINYL